MKKELEAQKAELKERFSEEIDSFYEEISKKLETRTLRIEDIERIMKEKKTKMSELITESTGQAVNEMEPTTEKKDVLNAEEDCTDKEARER